MTLASGIYTGTVRHRRFSPRQHALNYPVFMMYLDLDEIDEVMSKSFFWSCRGWAVARFKCSDYFGGSGDKLTPENTAVGIADAIKNKVEQELGFRPDGPVRLLTNLRYFGFIINPISVYYCFDKDDKLQAMVAEVTNTPWGEKIAYALPCESKNKNQRIEFNKAMHVSPFNPMDMVYRWRSNEPGSKIAIHLENWQDEKVMDATLALRREEISASALNKVLIRYPIMTAKVMIAIYWNALKLFFKRVPLYAHPGKA